MSICCSNYKKILVCPESKLLEMSKKKKKKKLWKYSAFMFFIGDQPWDFFGKNDAKAETPVLWPPHAKS